jgi:hypothetical protein
VYLIKSLIARMATATLVQVTAVTNTDTTAAVGFVDLQPLVSQVDPNMQPIPHAIIRNNPYFRMQGGKNAIIMDPEAGDVGIALFASRDISAVNNTLTNGAATAGQTPILPGSFRQYDMADALYLGGMLNGAPTQFIQFTSTGIIITSPKDVTVNAVNAKINASGKSEVVATGDVNLTTSGACNITSTGITTVSASEVDLKGAGALGGVVQATCVCSYTGAPHPMSSATVKATP